MRPCSRRAAALLLPQPWTILATGSLAVGGAYALSGGSWVWTGLVGVPVAVWWYLFLVLVPSAYARGGLQMMDADERGPDVS